MDGSNITLKVEREPCHRVFGKGGMEGIIVYSNILEKRPANKTSVATVNVPSKAIPKKEETKENHTTKCN